MIHFPPSLLRRSLAAASILTLTAGVCRAETIDITSPSDVITPVDLDAGPLFIGSSPANEQAPKAIDNNVGTKYLNFGGGTASDSELHTGFVVTPSLGLLTGGSIVTELRFTTANDGAARDPFTFLLEGTTGGPGGTFTTIATGSTGLETVLARLTQGPIVSFANTTAYTTYRLTFPNVRDVNAANSMQIAEAELRGTVVPLPSAACAGLGLLGSQLLKRRRSRLASA